MKQNPLELNPSNIKDDCLSTKSKVLCRFDMSYSLNTHERSKHSKSYFYFMSYTHFSTLKVRLVLFYYNNSTENRINPYPISPLLTSLPFWTVKIFRVKDKT